MFEGEAQGLQALESSGMRVPHVYGVASTTLTSPESSFIVMEKLALGYGYDMHAFGSMLGKMHMAEPFHEEAKRGNFGFVCDNTIGATYQPNGWSSNWIEFFKEKRLLHQIRLSQDTQLMQLGDKLVPKIDHFFKGIEDKIKPSIIHGDLWSGNVSGVREHDGSTNVVIFDPATYYGHHEAEFGMSWCAGFNATFWSGYREYVPKDVGFEQRQKLYKLYHYLNHYNLFGGGYKSECVSIMQYLLSQV